MALKWLNSHKIEAGKRFNITVSLCSPTMLARALSLRGFRRIQRNRSVLENHVQRIVVRTGRELYPQLKLKWPKLYKNIPPEGLRLEVDFLDTKQHHRMFDKIVLAIHGTPGDYRTYSKLCEHYLGSNVRVVVPNLPDFSHTRRQNFWHSIEEKACFIEDFLKKISVGTVHCLVGHSYGFHTVAGLLEQVILCFEFLFCCFNFFGIPVLYSQFQVSGIVLPLHQPEHCARGAR